MTLPVDSQVAKTLFTVEEYLAEERYEELTELLLNLAETHGRELVAVPAEANQAVNRYVNAATHCQRILASLPPAGRAVCRKLLDPPARRWLDAWHATRDEQHLLRILRTAYVSSYGDDALWELAAAAWDRGDYSLAAAYWSQLDPPGTDAAARGLAYPDTEFPAADVQARLLLCDIYSQRDVERRLAAYGERFGEARGTLAGREGRWIDLLRDVRAESRTWKAGETDPQIPTFGGANERQRSWSADLDLGPVRWTASWPVRFLPHAGLNPANDRGPLKSFPVVDRQHVFVSDGDAIRGWNLITGEPAWPNEQTDPSIIYPPVPQEQVSLPYRPCVGVPWQTLTVQQGKLYARMGSPLAGAAISERGDLLSELVCLDVRTGQGKLLWKLSAEDVPVNGPPWSFEGTPLVVDATAFVVLYRRHPEAEFALLALDADSGQIHWLRTIGSARPNVDEAVNRVSHLLLTGGDGRLYLSTDQGTILALAPQDGRLLWAVSYESQLPESRREDPPHLQSGLLPPVFSQGLLFAAPNDSRFLYCLEAASGRVVWQKDMREERLRSLIGVTTGPRRGRLIASGNSLWAFDAQDGALAWRMIQTDTTERGYGHGILTGSSVFWPTREWLFQLDQTTGELQRKIPLRTPDSPHSGGNLAVAQGLLLVVEPDAIAAYGEYSLLKSRLEIELSQRPDDALPWQRLMDLEASDSRWDAALSAGRRAWSLRSELSAAQIVALQARFAAVLGRQIARKKETRDFRAADDLFTELSLLPLSPDERGRLLWDWARLDLDRDEPALAVVRLHELLALHQQSRREIDGQSVNVLVRQELDRILKTLGREPFQRIELRAQSELAAAFAAGKLTEIREVLRRYPLLESADAVWSQLVTQAVRRKNWTVVWPLLEEWRAMTDSELKRSIIDQRKIATLQQAGYGRTAARLETPARTPDQIDPPRPWQYVVRDWGYDIPTGQTALTPHGSPPADSLACVLLAGTDLTALDRGTGAVRWNQPGGERPIWSGYGETCLLVASSESLSARSLETGERIWQRPWNRADRTSALRPEWIHQAGDRVVAFDPVRGVTAYSAITGDVVWEFLPPAHPIQPWWLCCDDWLLLQTGAMSNDPWTSVWVIETATGLLIRSGSTREQPWRQPPVDLGNGGLGVVTHDRQITGRGPTLPRRWTYAGAISHAHCDPWLIAAGDRLAALIDGTTLVGLDPETGQRRWSAGFADLPVIEPSRQIAVANRCAVTAWSGLIRAVSLDDGSTAWESELPADVADWRVAAECGRITATGTAKSHACCLMFDSITGRRVLQLRQACPPVGGGWVFDDQGVLFTTPQAITAWMPMEDTSRRQAGK